MNKLSIYTKSIGGKESNNKGCGCSSGASIEDLYESLKFENQYEIDYNNIETKEKKDNIRELNRLLSNSGENLVLSDANYDFVISKILPIITYDKKIISINGIPSVKEINDVVKSGKRIKVKASCC